MSSIPTRWLLPTPAPSQLRARFNWLHPSIVQILYNRGLTDPEDVAEYFGKRVRPDDPFRMKGVPEAVQRIRWAIAHDEPIAVYGDFDADGVTSTVLLVQALQAFGADVMPYIPHRVDEGYGLNMDALSWLHRQGMKVVITVDCGIRAVAEVEHANSLGLDMIITDHHSIGPKLPPALTVVNPRQSDCRYKQIFPNHFDALAGVGVAFKLAQALLRAEKQEPIAAQPLTLEEEDLLDLVALGTVADMMPLRHENRVLVQRGLKQLNLGRRPGVRALAKRAGVEIGQIDATAIGFRLGPRLNAAGRLRSAGLAYDLLMAANDAEAEDLADELNYLNRERQQLTQEAVRWALAELGEHPSDQVILLGRERLVPGIVGLVASRLKETYYRPALVAELGGDEVRGSARSIPEFHITNALDQCRDILVRYGGHAAAAGFTIRRDRLPELRRRLNEIAAEQLADYERVQKIPIDVVLSLQDLDYALLGKLRELEPTGAENQPPILAISDVFVRDYRRVGAEGNHLKLRVSDGMTTFDAIAFGKGDLAAQLPMRIDIAFHLEENNWQGQRSLQLLVRDIQPAGQGIRPSTSPPGDVPPLLRSRS
ncbi:MAG: single-stranded-DNA-specific exonuclease RecJ [Chloroflexi bacterium]|nr:single-stranded-DNA-specific exonuclease RecJ [Chloroflexota bacterium]